MVLKKCSSSKANTPGIKKSLGFQFDIAYDFSRWKRKGIWARLRGGQSPWKDCFDSLKHCTDLSSHWRSKTVHEREAQVLTRPVDQAHFVFHTVNSFPGKSDCKRNFGAALWHKRVLLSRWCPFLFGLELAACCEDISAVQGSFISSVSSLVDFHTNHQTKATQVKQLNVHLLSGNSWWWSHSVILSAVIFVFKSPLYSFGGNSPVTRDRQISLEIRSIQIRWVRTRVSSPCSERRFWLPFASLRHLYYKRGK